MPIIVVQIDFIVNSKLLGSANDSSHQASAAKVVRFLRGRDRAARGTSVRGQRAPRALAALSAIIPSTF
jgi:hypothetical protein